jgi:5-methylcytosine-specific restriction protein A
MSLADLDDRGAVLRAVEEFDRLGRDAFLEKYGFRPARGYFLVVGGRRYDSKAIAGAAHEYQFPDQGPLRPVDFSGGDATVKRKLESLGFTVHLTSASDREERPLWVEITRSEHAHGGRGWEFGTCLWSPSRDRAGGDRYAIMREPQPGDSVLHFYHDTWPDGLAETRLAGRSVVARAFREMDGEPVSPGQWAGLAPFYRIDLTNFEPFASPLPLRTLSGAYVDQIRQEILEDEPRYYPFATYGPGIRVTQGLYLGRLTSNLHRILAEALGIQSAAAAAALPAASVHDEYGEGMRRRREAYFFARNPALAEAAKRRYGYRCMICQFDFGENYGELGQGYIECHHLNPLSERPEAEWDELVRTRIEDVAVLCSNCHRMAHRRRPALSLEELTAALAGSGNCHPRARIS